MTKPVPGQRAADEWAENRPEIAVVASDEVGTRGPRGGKKKNSFGLTARCRRLEQAVVARSRGRCRPPIVSQRSQLNAAVRAALFSESLVAALVRVGEGRPLAIRRGSSGKSPCRMIRSRCRLVALPRAGDSSAGCHASAASRSASLLNSGRVVQVEQRWALPLIAHIHFYVQTSSQGTLVRRRQCKRQQADRNR